jgi:hypothetical protein
MIARSDNCKDVSGGTFCTYTEAEVASTKTEDGQLASGCKENIVDGKSSLSLSFPFRIL